MMARNCIKGDRVRLLGLFLGGRRPDIGSQEHVSRFSPNMSRILVIVQGWVVSYVSMHSKLHACNARHRRIPKLIQYLAATATTKKHDSA